MTGGSVPSATPAAWLVRGGETGDRENPDLDGGLVIIGWDELGDISGCDREGIRQALIQAYPDAAGNVIANWSGQLWRFRDQIAAGDLVVMPLKARPGLVAVGRITGPYEFRPLEPKGFRHVRQTT